MLRKHSHGTELLRLWSCTVFYAMITATVLLLAGRLVLDRRWMSEMIGAIWFCIGIAFIAMVVMRVIDVVDSKRPAD